MQYSCILYHYVSSTLYDHILVLTSIMDVVLYCRKGQLLCRKCGGGGAVMTSAAIEEYNASGMSKDDIGGIEVEVPTEQELARLENDLYVSHSGPVGLFFDSFPSVAPQAFKDGFLALRNEVSEDLKTSGRTKGPTFAECKAIVRGKVLRRWIADGKVPALLCQALYHYKLVGITKVRIGNMRTYTSAKAAKVGRDAVANNKTGTIDLTADIIDDIKRSPGQLTPSALLSSGRNTTILDYLYWLSKKLANHYVNNKDEASPGFRRVGSMSASGTVEPSLNLEKKILELSERASTTEKDNSDEKAIVDEGGPVPVAGL